MKEMSELNWSYKESWKNQQEEKKWRKRSFSLAWFDTGYSNAIIFPQSLGNGDTLQVKLFKTFLNF